MKKEEKDWFKLKGYPHLEAPIHPNRRKNIEKYILDKDKIRQHSFLPFIHKKIVTNKFRKKYSKVNGSLESKNINGKPFRVNKNKKVREIFYASHFDSLIYSYYASILSKKYEGLIKSDEYKIADNVTAYRAVPVNDSIENSSNKCNIHFAKDVFDSIKEYNSDDFFVIALDITSFFDNLDHKILLEKWAKVLSNDKQLQKDHFNVYKNITRFCYVEINEIFNYFRNNLRALKNRKVEKIPENFIYKKVHSIKYLRNQNVVSFCTKDEFLKVKHRFIKQNKDENGNFKKKGIPQGSPISAILANIYLIDFDKAVKEYVSNINGIYRRYSDDLVVICQKEDYKKVIEFLIKEIFNYKLEIKEEKTQKFEFIRENEILKCGQIFEDDFVNWNKNLIYLGFEFDGTTTLIKNSSLSGYYRKMKKHINRALQFTHGGKKPLFKRRIFKRFSYKGAKRRRVVLYDKINNNHIVKDTYNYGNFLTYAYKAAAIMKEPKIKNQTKKHWQKLNKLIYPKEEIKIDDLPF